MCTWLTSNMRKHIYVHSLYTMHVVLPGFSLSLPLRGVKSQLPGISFSDCSQFCQTWKLTPQEWITSMSCLMWLPCSPTWTLLQWSKLSMYQMRLHSKISPICKSKCSTMWSSRIEMRGDLMQPRCLNVSCMSVIPAFASQTVTWPPWCTLPLAVTCPNYCTLSWMCIYILHIHN